MELENCIEEQSVESMNDNLEGMSLSDCKMEYLQEALESGDKQLLVDRIDEINGDFYPPKALDCNADIKNLLKSSGTELPTQLLEAPNDFEQVEQASDALHHIEGADYENWKDLSVKDRTIVLQTIENKVAEIAHRPACGVNAMSLEEGAYGYFNPETHEIVVNSDYLTGDQQDYRECLDTIIHERRHAYQNYNLNERQVHTSPGDISNWKLNEEEFEYQDIETYGFKSYALQPVEADARKFAEDVITKFEKS